MTVTTRSLSENLVVTEGERRGTRILSCFADFDFAQSADY